MQVDFVWDVQTGDLKPIRKVLKKALDDTGCLPYWKEWRVGNKNLPSYLKHHKEFAIIINGYPVLFDFKDSNAMLSLKAGIEKYKARKHKKLLLFKFFGMFNLVIPFFVMLFPKCPVCWAAYFSFLSNVGIHIPYAPQLQMVFIVLGLIFCAYLFIHAKKYRGYLPPVLISASLLLAIANNFFLSVNQVITVICMILSLLGIMLLLANDQRHRKIKRFFTSVTWMVRLVLKSTN